jgi:hypothetical protein
MQHTVGSGERERIDHALFWIKQASFTENRPGVNSVLIEPGGKERLRVFIRSLSSVKWRTDLN